ncbi:MAG: hypothetical protein ABMA15_04315 [Vicinamibacterales bacterium]
MSGKRIFGLLSVVFGLLLALFGVWALVSAVRFTILQPLVIAVGGGLVLIGVMALKSAPASSQPSQDVPVAPSGARASSAGAVIALLLMGVSGWYYFGGGLESQANRTMQDIQSKVAADAVAQYGIAQRNGSAMDVCVQAGFVTAAYLQAQDEANYQRWKQTEKADCAKAGIEK